MTIVTFMTIIGAINPIPIRFTVPLTSCLITQIITVKAFAFLAVNETVHSMPIILTEFHSCCRIAKVIPTNNFFTIRCTVRSKPVWMTDSYSSCDVT